MLSIKVKGLGNTSADISKAMKYLEKDIEADLQDWGNDTANVARKIHKFGKPYSKSYLKQAGTPTGNGDRSIKAEAKGTQVRLYIDPDHVSVSSKKYGKFNYIWAQHDGTKRGIKADPFLEIAAEKNSKKLRTMIENTITRILG